MNGVDNLSYMTISSATITSFTAIATPSAPTFNAYTTLTAGAFPLVYRISANSAVGESIASAALTTTANKDRDSWSGTENVIINIPATGGNIVSYNIYCGVIGGGGHEFLIASGVTTSTFTDSGGSAMPLNYQTPYPQTDATAGPRVSRGSAINGRAFLCGDADNPYYVWWGGDPGYEFNFTPTYNGGYVPVGNGSKDIPINVKAFRDGKGTPQITVLSSGTNGRGKRFILSSVDLTLNGVTFSTFAPTEDSGADGSDSPDGIISYGNTLYYPSRDGFKSTGTKPQLQNVLSTDRISNTIQPDIKLLNSSAMAGCVGLGFEGRLYWAVPTSSSSNTEIWVLDLDRKGAWMKPWSIECDWMWLYNDNSGTTHFLILANNTIYELSYSSLTQDDGQPFSTQGSSGEIYFSDDKRMWVQLLQVVIVLLRPQGVISFEITGKTEDEELTALGDPTTFTSASQTSVAGWGEPNAGTEGFGQFDWSQVGSVPADVGTASQEVRIEIDEEVQWASYAWNSVGVGVDYNISDVIFEYIETGIKDLQ